MRLLNLELENWSCHSNLNINLSAGLQIEGRNGTGKSSILDAIRFVFAKSASGYKSKIKNGARSATVRLGFSKDENSYLVEKKLYLNRSSTARMLMNSTQIADNPSSVYSALQNILTEKVMDKLLYVPQGGLTELINNLRIKGGRQELDSLLGLDRFEIVYNGVKQELNSEGAKFDLLSKQLAKYPEDAERVYDKGINDLKRSISRLKEEVKKYEAQRLELNNQIKKLKDEINRLQGLKTRKDSLERRLSAIKLRIAENKKELDIINKNLVSIQKRKRELEHLIHTREGLQKFVPLRDLLIELEKNKERFLELNDLEERVENLKKLRDELEDKPGIEVRYVDQNEKIVSLERKIAAKNQQLNSENEYLQNLSTLGGAPKCPRCGQKLTKGHLLSEKLSTEKTIKKIKAELKELGDELKKSKKEFQSVEEKLKEFQKKEIEAGHLEEEIMKKERERKSIQNNLNQLNQSLYEMNYSGEKLGLVETRVNEFNRIQGEIQAVNEEIKQERAYSQRIKEIDSVDSQLKEEMEKIEEQFHELRYDESALNKIRTEKDRLQENYYKLSSEIENFGFRIREDEGKVKEIQDQWSEFQNLKRQESDITRRINLLKDAGDIFHTNRGIVKYLRERYISHLSALLTYYFKHINQNPKYREISFDKDYNIEIKTTEGNLTLDQLSGGEKVQLAIALRIALIELLSPTRLLILDEPFGSLDREHREILGESLNKIAVDGQLILVTHIPVDSLNLPRRLELGGY